MNFRDRWILAALLVATISGASPSKAANPPTSNDPVATMMAMLAKRGLISFGGEGALLPSIPSAPTGVEVEEFVETAKDNGEEIERTSNWDENFGVDSIRLQVARSPSGLKRVAYWVRRRNSTGCLLFGMNEYDDAGRLLLSKLWRNDSGQKPFRGPDYPASIFPNASEGGMPFDAFLRALSSPSVGATGVAYTQITPYEVVALDVWVAGVESVRVPAGEFSALKVVMRTDARSVGMPGFIATMVEPFLPKNIMYYQAEAPHRELKFEGVMDQGAPRIVVELVRYYTAGGKAQASAIAEPTASR